MHACEIRIHSFLVIRTILVSTIVNVKNLMVNIRPLRAEEDCVLPSVFDAMEPPLVTLSAVLAFGQAL